MELTDPDFKVRFLYDQLRADIIRFLNDYIGNGGGSLDELKDRFRQCLSEEENENIKNVKHLVDTLEEKGVIGQHNVEYIKQLAEWLHLEELMKKIERFESFCSGRVQKALNAAAKAPAVIWEVFKGGVVTSVIGLKTVLSYKGVQLTIATAALLLIYKRNPKALENLKPFLDTGIQLVTLGSNSVVFVLKISSISSMKRLWKSYKDGSFKKSMKKALNEMKELKELSKGEEIDVELTIDEKEYRKVFWNLILSEVKANDAKENVEKQPTLSRRHSIGCELDVSRLAVSSNVPAVSQLHIRPWRHVDELNKVLNNFKSIKAKKETSEDTTTALKEVVSMVEQEEKRLSEITQELSELNIVIDATGFEKVKVEEKAGLTVIGLKTVLSYKGVQLTIATAALLLIYKRNPKALENLKPFLDTGIQLVTLGSNSVVFVLKISSISSMKRLWKSYKDGSFKKSMKKALNEMKELKELSKGEEIDVELTIDEKEYRKVFWNLILSEVKANDAKENVEKQPTLSRRHSIGCELDVSRLAVSSNVPAVSQLHIRPWRHVDELNKVLNNFKSIKAKKETSEDTTTALKEVVSMVEQEEKRLSEITQELSELNIVIDATGFEKVKVEEKAGLTVMHDKVEGIDSGASTSLQAEKERKQSDQSTQVPHPDQMTRDEKLSSAPDARKAGEKLEEQSVVAICDKERMSEAQQLLLKERFPFFKDDVIPTELHDNLPCLTNEQKDQIAYDEKNHLPSKSVETLVEKLTEHKEGFEQFVEALRKADLGHVAALLDANYFDIPIIVRIEGQMKLEREIASKFSNSFSKEAKKLRQDFEKFLFKMLPGIYFVRTKLMEDVSAKDEGTKTTGAEDVPHSTEDSLAVVFRLNNINLLDKLWEIYKDRRLGGVFRSVLSKELSSSAVDLFFRKEDYDECKRTLKGVQIVPPPGGMKSYHTDQYSRRSYFGLAGSSEKPLRKEGLLDMIYSSRRSYFGLAGTSEKPLPKEVYWKAFIEEDPAAFETFVRTLDRGLASSVISKCSLLADRLGAPAFIKEKCKSSSIKKRSPTLGLLELPKVCGNLSVNDLVKKLMIIIRYDVAYTIETGIPDYQEYPLKNALRDHEKVFQQVAMQLDEPYIWNAWHSLGIKLGIEWYELNQIKFGYNPAKEFLEDCAYSTLEQEKLTVGCFRQHMTTIGRHDILNLLDGFGITQQHDARSIKDVIPPDSERMRKLSVLLNQDYVKDWRSLAHCWGIKHEAYSQFDPFEENPFKILLQDWLTVERPEFTVNDLCAILEELHMKQVKDNLERKLQKLIS